MRIKFERSGGFAGMMITKEIDVSKLKPTEAKKLTGLIQSAEFFKLPQKPVAAAGKRSVAQPDRFQYTVTIEDDNNKQHTVTASEQNLPPNLKPLVDWLSLVAKES